VQENEAEPEEARSSQNEDEPTEEAAQTSPSPR